MSDLGLSIFCSAASRGCLYFVQQLHEVVYILFSSFTRLYILCSAASRSCIYFVQQLHEVVYILFSSFTRLYIFCSAASRGCIYFVQQLHEVVYILFSSFTRLFIFCSAASRGCLYFVQQLYGVASPEPATRIHMAKHPLPETWVNRHQNIKNHHNCQQKHFHLYYSRHSMNPCLLCCVPRVTSCATSAVSGVCSENGLS